MATKKKVKALDGAERKSQLLDVGAKLAAKHGAANVTRRMVAKDAKCSEALVAHYMGDSAKAQKAYAARAKKLGLTVPTKEQAEVIGAKLRAHGPRKNKVVRRRSVKEVKAIKEKSVGKSVAKRLAPVKSARAVAAKKTPAASPRKASAGTSASPAKKTTAARAPKKPPINELPPLPPMTTLAAGNDLPPLPGML